MVRISPWMVVLACLLTACGSGAVRELPSVPVTTVATQANTLAAPGNDASSVKPSLTPALATASSEALTTTPTDTPTTRPTVKPTPSPAPSSTATPLASIPAALPVQVDL